ncbi:MAG: ATP-dependent DNA helicase [Proteobacteria bacterium]|nr:ATP-dependent DNA helicase [Pseudomonadota bacterium]
MAKLQATGLHTIIEKFGVFYLYDGSQTQVFNSLKDLKRYLLNEKIPYIASLDLSLQDLNIDNCLEVLDLLVFVFPTCKAAPLVKSIAKFLKLKPAVTEDQEAEVIYRIVETLINKINYKNETYRSIFSYMGLTDWPWARLLNNHFKIDFELISKKLYNTPEQKFLIPALKKLEKWNYDLAPDYSEINIKTPKKEHIKKTLEKIVGAKGGQFRQQQLDYSLNLADNFDVYQTEEKTSVAIMQAPTGVGKTIGYLAPSLVCSRQNKMPIWISTFTKNLQQQVQESLTEFKDIKIALRKGRKNYTCLLKTQGIFERNKHYFNGFVTLWLKETKDGDIISGDFPQWLFSIHKKRAVDYTDFDEDCSFAACPYFKQCFIQSSIQNANNANIVVSNHALSIIQGTVNLDTCSSLPPIVIFDEAHELFSAVDEEFCSNLSALELKKFADFLGLRNKKGILQHLHEVLQYFPSDEGIFDNMGKIVALGEHLPTQDWFTRFSISESKEEKNISQRFFNLVYKTVLQQNTKNGYSNLQTDVKYLFKNDKKEGKTLKLLKEAEKMSDILEEIDKNLKIMNDKIDILIEQTSAEDIESDMLSYQLKLQGLQNSIKVKQQYTIAAWVQSLKIPEDDLFSTFLELIIGKDGRVYNVGVRRHFVNPMKPFADLVLSHIDSVSLTSATIADKETSTDEEWATALRLTGVDYIKDKKLTLHQTKTPFDYKKQAKVLIVTDVNYNNRAELSKAVSGLFIANNGHALGLFTAISRLQGVYSSLKNALKKDKINLYAQHMQSLDVATLVDVFAEDKTSCLIGTDALKQGVDVVGQSLSLVVCDKLPRPVPSILMKAREKEFGRKYRNLLTRMSLKQAFGRLIRTMDDTGTFVLLDPRINRSEIKAFPPEIEVEKVTLAEAINIINTIKHKKRERNNDKQTIKE